ncbi:unnamed protein product [Prunus armeniaca]
MGETGSQSRPSFRTWPGPSFRTWPGPSLGTRVQPAKIRAVIPTMGADVTLVMGETRSRSRSSLWPWPGPSFWTQLWLGEARAITSVMDATKVLGQTDMAKLEPSYQALPSS